MVCQLILLQSDSQYTYRFREWNVQKYTRQKTIDELLDDIIDRHHRGLPPPQFTVKDLDKLRRRCRQREKDNPNPILKSLLLQMRDSPLMAMASPAKSENTQESAKIKESERSSDTSADETPSNFSDDEFDLGTRDDDFEILDHSPLQNHDGNSGDRDIEFCIANLQISSLSQTSGLEEVLRLTQSHYQISIQHYLNSAANNMMEVNKATASQPDGLYENLVDSLAFNRTFWTKIKSGIYYLKEGKDSEDLAIALLKESSAMIPALCRQQPFTMWKDIFATLSPVNIAVRQAFLSGLLRALTGGAHEACVQHPEHPFPLICDRLGNETLFQEASTMGLRLLHQTSLESLPAGHEEIYEVQRTFIRLLRRQGKLADAERLSKSFIERSASQYGRCSERARLAMTERIYVLNDQGRFQDSKGLAESVIEKGNRNSQIEPIPNQRHVYAMEDLAFICDRLGLTREAISWLRRAQKHALLLWKDREGTIHINRKLEDAYAKLSREQ